MPPAGHDPTAPSALSARVTLHAVAVVLAAWYWSIDGNLSAGYDISFGQALVVTSLPALPLRMVSTWVARNWLARQQRRGPRSPLACFAHLALADLLVSALLGVMVFPLLVLTYFVAMVPAYSLLLPPVPLAASALAIVLGQGATKASPS